MTRLRQSAPRKLLTTFKRFTRHQGREPSCTPDEQWMHWASQGGIVEPVWNDVVMALAQEWVEHLRT